MNLQLEVTLATGGDDLRSGSWADLIMKIKNVATPLEADKFTGTGGLPNNSTRQFHVNFTVPNTFKVSDIEFFQLRHVSQESFGQTADNWNLNHVSIDIVSPSRVRDGGAHRFDGSHRVFGF